MVKKRRKMMLDSGSVRSGRVIRAASRNRPCSSMKGIKTVRKGSGRHVWTTRRPGGDVSSLSSQPRTLEFHHSDIRRCGNNRPAVAEGWSCGLD